MLVKSKVNVLRESHPHRPRPQSRTEGWDREKIGKGVILSKEELLALKELLKLIEL